MTTLAYLRVSKDTQDTKNQRLAILEFAHAERIAVESVSNEACIFVGPQPLRQQTRGGHVFDHQRRRRECR